MIATLAVVAAADFFLYRGARASAGPRPSSRPAMLVVLAVRDTRLPQHRSADASCWLATLGLLARTGRAADAGSTSLYILVCLSALALINSAGWETNFCPLGAALGALGGRRVGQVFLDNGLAMRWLVRHGLPLALARRSPRGCCPFCSASVFVAHLRLGQSDHRRMDFARWARGMSDALARLPEIFNIGRIFFWLVFAALAWALLRSRDRRARTDRAFAAGSGVEAPDRRDSIRVGQRRHPGRARRALPDPLQRRSSRSRTCWTCGTCTAAHFGSRRDDVQDITSAAARIRWSRPPCWRARSCWSPSARAAQTERSNAARKLVYLWIGQTILLTVSAAWRLQRYVALTELTRLRVASTIWFLLVALGLFYIIWRIVARRSNGVAGQHQRRDRPADAVPVLLHQLRRDHRRLQREDTARKRAARARRWTSITSRTSARRRLPAHRPRLDVTAPTVADGEGRTSFPTQLHAELVGDLWTGARGHGAASRATDADRAMATGSIAEPRAPGLAGAGMNRAVGPKGSGSSLRSRVTPRSGDADARSIPITKQRDKFSQHDPTPAHSLYA